MELNLSTYSPLKNIGFVSLCFNVKTNRGFNPHSTGLCVSATILRINRLVLVLEVYCVFCEVEAI
jgi:hypothetical protein